MEFMFNNFWIFMLPGSLITAYRIKKNSKAFSEKNPALIPGYEAIVRTVLVFGNLPWIIMGIGNLTGLTNSAFEFLQPRMMNPIVLIFQASIVLIWGLSARWIYFKDGASFLEAHPSNLTAIKGFSGRSYMTARQVKIWFPIMLLGGVVGLVLMWFVEYPN